MAKKPMSEEQKAVLRERLAKARAAKAAKTNTSETKSQASMTPGVPANDAASIGEPITISANSLPDDVPRTSGYVHVDEPQTTISVAQYEELKRQIAELQDGQFGKLMQAIEGRGELGSPKRRGEEMVGAIERHSTNLEEYPNPVERLKNEPRLAQFAFGMNYTLAWQVTVTTYQTADKIWYKEPRFFAELHGIMRGDDGNPTGEEYVISRLFMHEDQEAAMAIARDEGVEVSEDNAKLFMDELRYLRVRDWLLENFFPKPVQRTNREERVVNGKLVQVVGAVDNGQPMKIDWNKVARVK